MNSVSQDMYVSSDEDDNIYIVESPEVSWHNESGQKYAKESEQGAVSCDTLDEVGSCAVTVNNTQQNSATVVNQQVTPLNQLSQRTSGGVHTTCGEWENKCLALPITLQAQITVIKESLLLKYPPFYDFCVIASDVDFNEALRFKEYVSSFGLAGCTLYDGFISLGADLFQSYELMMDQSSKVFFFLTENFTSNAFCKRLQSGAVFSSLMSKAKKDQEKCVPVFPNGFCRAPLALSGIAGLNPMQCDVMKHSLHNTYTPLLRHRRYIWDLENYKKRCHEFEIEVTKCIAEYEINSSNALEPNKNTIPCSASQENEILQNSKEYLEYHKPPSQLSSQDNSDEDISEAKISHNSLKSKFCTTSPTLKPKKCENNVNTKECPTSFSKDNVGKETSDTEGDDDEYDIFKGLPIPNEIRKTLKNELGSNLKSLYNVTQCENVHIGPSIQVIINQTSNEDMENVETFVKHTFTDSSGKGTTVEQDSDSSD